MWKIAAVLFAAMLSLRAADPAQLGVAPTPRNFPRHTPEDVAASFKQSAELGPIGVFIYQWSQPDFLDAATKTMLLCRQHKLTPVLSLSPTKLDARGKLDVPKTLVEKHGDKVSFTNPHIIEAYFQASVALAKLRPAYLCLATEINFLALENPKEYLAFAEVYRRIYKEVKMLSPETKVFVSFQWDICRLIDEKEPGKISEHTKLIDVFRPALDVIAFTSYPFEVAGVPEKVPASYYEGISKHVTRDDTVVFTELGWPSGGKSTEAMQEAFIKRLPELFKKVKPKFVAWSLLHDVDIPEFNANLGTTGLLTAKGKAKPGLAAFKELKLK
ncbi:MAG TPA: hypothetical protein VEJ63_19740 [Planctomycetota bacterium]|nr:hypothetical protein [Planctomycetota bacterium]